MPSENLRVILADPQPVFREGVKSLLTADPCIDYQVREASDTSELKKLLTDFRPDILILDYNPDYFDPDQLSLSLSVNNQCKVIIISSQEKEWNIIRSLDFNVYCYLTKECGKKDIYSAINSAIRGEKFFCSFILDVLLADRKRAASSRITCGVPCITGRESEIIRLIVRGKTNKEIAAELHLSPHTVHTHRRNIMKKLNVHSVAELCHVALQKGFVHPGETSATLYH